ncbi:hypothetical protein [Thermoflexus sp.]|uniref:hypothetical protein n=1 Tax=Thermoflexus sp. TaxID=1969742 RepID=UPI002ADD500D|nr:hypothetical protein [Thermoflexus sp.]
MSLLDSDHLWIYRWSGSLNPLARYEIRDAGDAILGHAVEERPSVWMLALKVTRMRPMTPLVLLLRDASGFPVFSLVRSWDWWGTKPVEIQNAAGIPLLRFRSHGFLGHEVAIEDPFLGPIGKIRPLQVITLGDRRYEAQDPDGHSVASFRWIQESIWWPSRRCEVRVERGAWRERWPFAPLAAALMVALRVEAR